MKANEPLLDATVRPSLKQRVAALSPGGWLLLFGAILPPSLVFAIQKKHWVNIPIWDEWDTPGIALLHFFQRTLTWGDLISQHNESRKLVPRLIHIAIASVAGWDVRQGMVLTFLAACAASACALAYLRSRRDGAPMAVLFAWMMMNLFLFAPSQYENFLSGFIFEIFIPYLCLFGCCAINLSRRSLLLKVLANAALAAFSSYTFAHGMLLWVFAIPLPSNDTRSGVNTKFRLVLSYLLYAAFAALTIGYYFQGYVRPKIAGPLPHLSQFPQLVEFVAVWLGAVLRSPFVDALTAGILVSLLIIATLSGVFLVLRRDRQRWPTYYPWLWLLGFALASGAMTAVGRSSIAIHLVFNTWFNGFSSMRYNAASVFAYVAVIGLLFHLARDLPPRRPGRSRDVLIAATALLTLLAVAWLEMFASELVRVKEFQANRRRARSAIVWINALPQNPDIFLAYPYPDGFWQRAAEMRKAGLIALPTVSEALAAKIATAPGTADPAAGNLDVAEPQSTTHVRFAGWGRDPVKGTSADYVVLGWHDSDKVFHPFTAIPTGKVRPDVAEAYGAAALKAGFDQSIEVGRLPPEAMEISAWAVNWPQQEAFALPGSVQLPRR